MTNKQICFFRPDSNEVMILELPAEKYTFKTIAKPDFKFYSWSSAVTIPNGDCIITGG